jgi:hypothetical protein
MVHPDGANSAATVSVMDGRNPHALADTPFSVGAVIVAVHGLLST